jgi:hypothetical protein
MSLSSSGSGRAVVAALILGDEEAAATVFGRGLEPNGDRAGRRIRMVVDKDVDGDALVRVVSPNPEPCAGVAGTVRSDEEGVDTPPPGNPAWLAPVRRVRSITARARRLGNVSERERRIGIQVRGRRCRVQHSP